MLYKCLCTLTSFSSTDFLVFKHHQREPATSHKYMDGGVDIEKNEIRIKLPLRFKEIYEYLIQ